jgi:hypothetical protein
VEALNQAASYGAPPGETAPIPIREGKTLYEHRLARPLALLAVAAAAPLVFLQFRAGAGGRWQAVMLLVLAITFAVRAFSGRRAYDLESRPTGAPPRERP